MGSIKKNQIMKEKNVRNLNREFELIKQKNSSKNSIEKRPSCEPEPRRSSLNEIRTASTDSGFSRRTLSPRNSSDDLLPNNSKQVSLPKEAWAPCPTKTDVKKMSRSAPLTKTIKNTDESFKKLVSFPMMDKKAKKVYRSNSVLSRFGNFLAREKMVISNLLPVIEERCMNIE